MAEYFSYDVFLSHSSKDKAVVREMAQRLKADGVRVWFDEWELRPGDPILSKIEQGLESSRVLVLCMSAHAFGSDWAQLEGATFRFRDPLNRERRFIPVRLDDAPARGSLGQFLFVDWRAGEYEKLLDSCRGVKAQLAPQIEAERELLAERIISLGHTDHVRSVAFSPNGKLALSGSADKTVRLWDVERGHCVRVLEGHLEEVWSVAWSPDGHRALSGSADNTVRLWDVESGSCRRVMKGHSSIVWSVAWSRDGRRSLSGSADNTVRLWDVESGRCRRVMKGHSSSVLSVAWSPDGRRALSGSGDATVRLWDVEGGGCLRVLEGHSDSVWSVEWSPDGRRALSGSEDTTVRLWDVESGRCRRVMKGHSDSVWSVAWSTDGRRSLSGSADNTVRLWDVKSGACVRVLEGHSADVWSVAWSPDGRRSLTGSEDNTVRLWDVESGGCLGVLEGHSSSVLSVALSPDGRRSLSGSGDATVRLWDVESGGYLRVLEGHSSSVFSVEWSPDGRRALSGSADNTVRLWDVESGSCLCVLEGLSASVWSVAWSQDGRRSLSGSGDTTVRLWDVDSGGCLRVLEGHSSSVWSVAWSPDGERALSGSADNTVRLWDVYSGACLRVLEGHSDGVLSVAWSPDGRLALSGSADNTVRLWDVYSGACLRVLEGHSASVRSVAWSPDGRRALSGCDDHTVRLWDVYSGACLRVLEGHSASVRSVAWSPNGCHAFSAAHNGVLRIWNLEHSSESEPQYTNYTNAKVLLVGESGAGKTGLSLRLASNDWKASDSTVGAWATQWKLPVPSEVEEEREIWLWDFGGQADQRLIHQLYMEDTALAVLVFDGQKEDLFETLGQWDRDLTRASGKPFQKLLAAGRVDAGGLRASRNQIETFMKERGFDGYIETSAKHGTGCQELTDAILAAIDWSKIPWRSSPLLFKRLKEEIVRFKDEGRVLMRFNELRDALRLSLAGQGSEFKDEELRAVVSLLSGPGMVWELKFGNWILLQPERLNAYAQAVIQTLRADKSERGCLFEGKVLSGDLSYHSSMQRLDQETERFVLLAMHQMLVERGLCLREHTDQGPLLIFPSYYRRERPELTGHPAVLVSYRFHGFLDDIYSTLVVRLHHSGPFSQDQLWRHAADFKTLTGKQLGIKVTRRGEGSAELEVYFDPAIAIEEKIIFTRYVHEHLQQKASDVVRLRHYVCPHCGTPLGDHERARQRLESGQRTILCQECEKRVPLWDQLEDLFGSAETKKRVLELERQSARVLDDQSRERALVGEVISTVALAGQISRELNVSNHGIDMEIEFRNEFGEPTGRRLYLVLESGKAEVLEIQDERQARYWMAQAFPVMLVVRNSKGEVRWMEVRDWLKRATDDGRRTVKQIVFEGERFDVMSVRRMALA